MRNVTLIDYKKPNDIEYKKISDVAPAERSINISKKGHQTKFVKRVEAIVRSSLEYKEYIAFLKANIDMNQCSFFHNIRSGSRFQRTSIEIHHEPFTLFTITQMVTERWIQEEIPLNRFGVAEEVMKLHFQNKVGLIPLSKTVHKLVHGGKLFIPLQSVRGDFISLLKEYDPYISEEAKTTLEKKLLKSKDISSLDTSVLEKKYIYIEVDGFRFPSMDGIAAKEDLPIEASIIH